MHGLKAEALAFQSNRLAETAEARQRAALRLCCSIDLEELERADPESRTSLIGKIERALRREHLKGARMHWSYDLNRHIALKQVLDRFRPNATVRNILPRRIARRLRSIA